MFDALAAPMLQWLASNKPSPSETQALKTDIFVQPVCLSIASIYEQAQTLACASVCDPSTAENLSLV